MALLSEAPPEAVPLPPRDLPPAGHTSARTGMRGSPPERVGPLEAGRDPEASRAPQVSGSPICGRPPVPDVDKRTAGPLRCGPDAIVSIGHGERPRRVRPPAGREARCRWRWRSPRRRIPRPPCRRGRAAGRARCGPRPCRPAPRLPRLRHRRGPRTSRSRREDHGTKPPPRRAFPVGTTGRRRLAGALTRIDARPAGSHPVPARPSGAASGRTARPARPARPVSSCGAGVRPPPLNETGPRDGAGRRRGRGAACRTTSGKRPGTSSATW